MDRQSVFLGRGDDFCELRTRLAVRDQRDDRVTESACVAFAERSARARDNAYENQQSPLPERATRFMAAPRSRPTPRSRDQRRAPSARADRA